MPASSPSAEPRGKRARWRALPTRDKRRLAALAILLALIDASLRLFKFKRTQGWLLRHAGTRPQRPCTPEALQDAERLAELAAIAGRHGAWANTCLRQALAVQWWLRRDGLPAQLRIGARKQGDVVDAHAWVELEGVALAQPNLAYHAFGELGKALRESDRG